MFDYCRELFVAGHPVCYSPLVVPEFLQTLRVIATVPGMVQNSDRRRFRLHRSGEDAEVRSGWFRLGLSELELFLGQFSAVYSLPIDDDIIERSADLMSQYHLKSYDALHAQCAIEFGASALATVDAHFVVIQEIEVHLIRDASS